MIFAHFRSFACFFYCLIVLFALVPSVNAEKVIDISDAEARKLMVAIPNFVDLSAPNRFSEQGVEMANLLGRALEFHGFAKVVDSRQYGGVRDVNWKKLGADYAIICSFEANSSGVVIEGRLLDVAKGGFAKGLRYRGSLAQQQDMILRLGDAFVEQFTGEQGISRTKIAFISDASGYKEAYVADVLGLNVRQVTRHRNLVVSPRLSRDGNYLCYSSYHAGNQNLYITDLRQNKVTRAISRRKGMNMAPAWSPDGKTMAVTLSKDGSPDLYLIDRLGHILERLTSRSGINVSPSWSPDGSSLAFVSDRSGTPQIYIMDVKSKRARRLTFTGSENTEPCWSPNGDSIVFTSMAEGRYQLFTVNPNEMSSPRQIIASWGNFEAPTWSPDGKQIVFSRERNGKHELCAVLKNGKGMRVLFRMKGNQSYPRWSSRP